MRKESREVVLMMKNILCWWHLTLCLVESLWKLLCVHWKFHQSLALQVHSRLWVYCSLYSFCSASCNRPFLAKNIQDSCTHFHSWYTRLFLSSSVSCRIVSLIGTLHFFIKEFWHCCSHWLLRLLIALNTILWDLWVTIHTSKSRTYSLCKSDILCCKSSKNYSINFCALNFRSFPLFMGNAAFLYLIHSVVLPTEQSMVREELNMLKARLYKREQKNGTECTPPLSSLRTEQQEEIRRCSGEQSCLCDRPQFGLCHHRLPLLWRKH